MLKLSFRVNFLLFMATMGLAIFGDADRVTGRIVASIVFLFFYVFLAICARAADQLLDEKRAEKAKEEGVKSES